MTESWDPRAAGALCEMCYFYQHRSGVPVPTEHNAGALAFIVGEAPGEQEVEAGRPFVGAAGRELMAAIQAIGKRRADFSFGNVIACRPKHNNLDLALHQWQKANRARTARGLPPTPHPIQCCAPRLLGDIRGYENFILAGKVALQAFTGTNQSILELRGGPLKLWFDGVNLRDDIETAPPNARIFKVLPTLHPAFVCRMRRWTQAFRADIGRAVRWFENRLGWNDPQLVLWPTFDEIDAFLSSAREIAYDVETDGIEPLTCSLRCIGFATSEKALVVPFLSIDGETRFYSSRDEERIAERLRAFFADTSIVKVGHNAGYYDRMVIERHLGVTPRPLVDTILLHRAVAPELPHTLGFVGSVYTDVTAWKAGKEAVNVTTDARLHAYCGTDVVVTARVFPALMRQVEARGQLDAVELMHRIQGVCVGLHRNGVYVDQVRRAEHDSRLLAEACEARDAALAAAGEDGYRAAKDYGPKLKRGEEPRLNPGSVPQVRALLYEIWKFTPPHFSKLTKEPSTDDDAIRALLFRPALSDAQRQFLLALRKYRQRVKFRGTYVLPLRAATETLRYDEFAVNVESDEEQRGLILADGRVHPEWNSHTVVTLRLSSSRPNLQNISRKMRDMFVAEAGRVFVGADMDQIELRVCAALAKCDRYLEVFAKGGDPHRVSCELIFGKAFSGASEKDQKRLRDFAKRFTYALLYGASIETVHETITSAENDDGDLLFGDLTLAQTRDRYRAWLKGAPEFEKWWADTLEEYRRQQYLTEPVVGHRCDFLDGEDRNAIINFKAQAAAAVIVHQATIDLLEEIPFQRWGPGTGLVQQGHDALVVECPASAAEWTKKTMEAAMCRRARGLDVPFTAKGKIGQRWSEV